jgi:uncharacterized membrane protein YvbJ
MMKLTPIALMTLLVVASFALSACGSASGPELTVRAYIDAVNAGDKDKIVSLCSPDIQELASTKYDYYYEAFNIKYPTVKKIVIQDFQGNPDIKDVTVEVVEESSFGKHEKTLRFGLSQQEGQWYIFSPP